MDKYEFLKTNKGKRSRLLYHLVRRVRLTYNSSYISTKNSSDRKKIRIIKDTVQQMKKIKRASFKSEIACNIKINSLKSNLPETYHITKNFLDLLSKKWVKTKYGFRSPKIFRLPYIDDQQISYLAINFHPSKENNLDIEISKFTHFLNDISLASELIQDSKEDVEVGTNIDWHWQLDFYKKNEKELKQRLGILEYQKHIDFCKKESQHDFWIQNKLDIPVVNTIFGI